MKILIVTQYFWPESFRINDMALALSEQGHTINVLTGLPNYPKGTIFPGYHRLWPHKETYRTITIYRVPLFPRGNANSWRLCLNYLSFTFFASLLGPFLCHGKYDIVFCFQPSPVTVGIPAILLKKIKKAPLFFWVQDAWPETLVAVNRVKSSWLLAFVKRLVKWIYQQSDKILIPSESLLPKITAHGIEAEKINYFPNWAETFYQPLSSSDVNFPPGFIILFAGNHGEAQALDCVMQAAFLVKKAHVDHIHWVFIGEGHRKTFLQTKAQQMQLQQNVHFFDGKPAKEMPRYFANADALLVTLAKQPIFAITIPSKLQSYMACAKPIIAAIDGEAAKIIEQAQAGMTCPPEQAQALANTAIQLYQSSDKQRQLMADNAYRYYQQHFARSQLLANLINHFNKAIS